MSKKHRPKTEAQLAVEEQTRNLEIGLALIRKNCADFAILVTDRQGRWIMDRSSNIYARGAGATIERIAGKFLDGE